VNEGWTGRNTSPLDRFSIETECSTGPKPERADHSQRRRSFGERATYTNVTLRSAVRLASRFSFHETGTLLPPFSAALMSVSGPRFNQGKFPAPWRELKRGASESPSRRIVTSLVAMVARICG